MNKTEEKGVTLVALVATIVVLLILSSIGITAGRGTISMAKFARFKEELKILQTKVNELNQDNEFNVGQELIDTQKSVLEINAVSDIIYKEMTNEEITEIKNGFRYCDKDYIKDNFQFDNIENDYLINVKYRYVVCLDGFKYQETTYYMIDQIDEEIYNVRYDDKNPKEGDFEFNATYTKEDDRWKIEVSNINYPGYIKNWKVEYRLDPETEWKNANTLSFYVTKAGNYYVKVSYEDINLGTKLVSIVEETTTDET